MSLAGVQFAEIWGLNSFSAFILFKRVNIFTQKVKIFTQKVKIFTQSKHIYTESKHVYFSSPLTSKFVLTH